MKKFLIISLSLVILVILGWSFFFNSKKKNQSSAGGVQTVKVQRGDVQLKVIETGFLEPFSIVEIKSEQSGEIRKVFVEEGDKVKAGAPLAVLQLDSNLARQAAQFKANVETEALNVREAQRELERQKTLLEKGFISKKEMETAEKNLENAKIKHTLAKRSLFLLLGGNKGVYEKFLARDLSSDQLDEFIISSPTTGTVIEVKVAEGEMITSGTSTVGGGTTLMNIADLQKMRATSKINEINISKVKIGQPVEIRLDAVPEKRYRGIVTHISPQGKKEDNIVTYEVTMEIDSPDENLMPSMTANVDIITNVLKDVLYLPLEAVKREGINDIVYLPGKEEESPRPVTVRLKTETLAVISEGVAEGDRVVIPEREKT